MKRMRSKTLLPALSTILLAGGAFAEDNLTKLGQFKTTGVTEFTTIAVPGIEIATDLTEITYWHFICAQHQVVFAEGAASESLYTGPEALKMLGAEARAEIYQIFPQLRDAPPHYAPKPARPILSQEDSKSPIFQHYRSRTALCRQNSDAGMRPV